jgi:cutinase
MIKAATKCPSTKIVLSGYSQGAQLVANAAGKISAANAARVVAGKFASAFATQLPTNFHPVVNFGDPNGGRALSKIPSSKVLTVCHSGDNICEGGSSITAAHLNYQQDAPAAATFVAARV